MLFKSPDNNNECHHSLLLTRLKTKGERKIKINCGRNFETLFRLTAQLATCHVFFHHTLTFHATAAQPCTCLTVRHPGNWKNFKLLQAVGIRSRGFSFCPVLCTIPIQTVVHGSIPLQWQPAQCYRRSAVEIKTALRAIAWAILATLCSQGASQSAGTCSRSIAGTSSKKELRSRIRARHFEVWWIFANGCNGIDYLLVYIVRSCGLIWLQCSPCYPKSLVDGVWPTRSLPCRQYNQLCVGTSR